MSVTGNSLFLHISVSLAGANLVGDGGCARELQPPVRRRTQLRHRHPQRNRRDRWYARSLANLTDILDEITVYTACEYSNTSFDISCVTTKKSFSILYTKGIKRSTVFIGQM